MVMNDHPHFLLGENEAQVMHLAAAGQKLRGFVGARGFGRCPRPKDTGSPNDKLVFQKQHELRRPQAVARGLAPCWNYSPLDIL